MITEKKLAKQPPSDQQSLLAKHFWQGAVLYPKARNNVIELTMFGDANDKNRTGVWHFVSVTKQTPKDHHKNASIQCR
jgi:hypothetical protein